MRVAAIAMCGAEIRAIMDIYIVLYVYIDHGVVALNNVGTSSICSECACATGGRAGRENIRIHGKDALSD